MGTLPGFRVLLCTAVCLLPVAGAEAQSRPSDVRPAPPGNAPSADKPALAKPSPALAKPSEARPILTVQEGRLTVQVQNRPLDWVLDEISRQGRVAIAKPAGGSSERVSVHLRDVALDEGLRQILKDYDAFFFYSADKKGPASLRAVWVYPKGQARGFAPVPPEAWASTRELRNEAETNPDPAARARAIEALVERRGDQAADVVMGALQDGDDDVRTRTLYGALGAGVAIPPDLLAHLALADSSPNVRFLALQALATDPKAKASVDVAGVATQALNDPSPHVQIKAREILARREQAAQRPAASQPVQGQRQQGR